MSDVREGKTETSSWVDVIPWMADGYSGGAVRGATGGRPQACEIWAAPEYYGTRKGWTCPCIAENVTPNNIGALIISERRLHRAHSTLGIWVGPGEVSSAL